MPATDNVPDRFQQDLQRGREYIAAARPRAQVSQNIGDALFGEYTCQRCCSYQHKDSDHGDYCPHCGSTLKHPEQARDICPTYENAWADR